MALGTPDAVVVVGAGVAGVTAAGQLRALGYAGRLTVIGAERHLPYERPPLSKHFLLGSVTGAQILLRPESWYVENQIELRLGVEVEAVSPAERRVRLSRGAPERADAVLLATGGTARRLAVPGADHPALFGLRTMDDAEQLRDRLTPGTRVGVVGAGLIGAEVAAAATARGGHVTLIDPVDRPLAGVVGAAIADRLREEHRRHGVRLVRGGVDRVEGLDADRGAGGAGVRLRVRDTGESVECDVVVVGIGIEPEVGLAARAGLAVDGGILVDALQVTSQPGVLAAGDGARPTGPEGPRRRSEHWDSAQQQGRAAAAAILGAPAPVPRAPWFWSDRYGLHLEAAGAFDPAAPAATRGDLAAGDFIVLAVRDGICVGAVALNRPAELQAARRLIERRRPVDVGHLADPSTDLRAVARG